MVGVGRCVVNAHRDPAAIAAELRQLTGDMPLTMRAPVYDLADEIEALPVLTAEEVATLRGIAASLAARDDATWLDQIADKLDPPTVEEEVVTLTVPVSVASEIAESIRARRRPVGSLAGDPRLLRPDRLTPVNAPSTPTHRPKEMP